MKPEILSIENNLKVLNTKMSGAESASVWILVGVGSRYENKDLNGIAHFAEHMFFKGTKSRPNAVDISSIVDGIGGEFNAFTSKENTGFYIKAAKKHFDLIMDLLSDMVLRSKFEQAEIGRERGVIAEELRMYLDTPVSYIRDLFEQLLYGDQPLGWDIVGNLNSLKNINREQFLEYLNSYYNPSNMLVSIAGGVEKPLEVVGKYLGKMEDKKSKNFSKVKLEQKEPRVKLFKKDTQQAQLCLGFRGYPRGHKNRYELTVLNAILGASMSSRLFIQVRERRGLAYYVRTGVEEYYDTGYFVAQAGVEPKNINEAVKVTLGEFQKISVESVSEKELSKAKEYIKGKLILELEDSKDVAAMFGMQQLLENKIRTPEEIMEKIDRVTADDIKEVAKDIFRNEKLNLAIIGPYKEEGEFVKILTLE